jgi:hypothetical protein
MNNDENNTNINPGVQTETPGTPVEPVVQPEVPAQPIAESAAPVSQPVAQPEIAPAASVVESPSPAETSIFQPTPAATDVVQNTVVQPAVQITPQVQQPTDQPVQQFANPVPNAIPPKKNNTAFIVIIVILVLVLFAIVGILIFSKLLPKNGGNNNTTTTTTTAVESTTTNGTTTTTTGSIYNTTTSNIYNTTTTSSSGQTVVYDKSNKAFTCEMTQTVGSNKIYTTQDVYFNISGYGVLLDTTMVADFGSLTLNQTMIDTYLNTVLGSGACSTHDCTKSSIDFSDITKYGTNTKASVVGNKITISYDAVQFKGSTINSTQQSTLKDTYIKSGYTCN